MKRTRPTASAGASFLPPSSPSPAPASASSPTPSAFRDISRSALNDPEGTLRVIEEAADARAAVARITELARGAADGELLGVRATSRRGKGKKELLLCIYVFRTLVYACSIHEKKRRPYCALAPGY
jgi:hypothetical protein